MKDFGVAGGRLQGHSWAPTPLKGSRVNVATTSLVPDVTAGKTGRPLMSAKWGGGPVVVRERERRVHGEGSSVLSESMRGEEAYGEYRRFVARPG